MHYNDRHLAQLLCELSDKFLWQPRIAWAQSRIPNVQLTFKVGTGKKTYHMGDGNTHAITFGSKMVLKKRYSARACAVWTTGQEILQRGYFGSRLELPELLTHTACHEFAHFVQVILGRRYRGSCHNDEFYQILDRIHHKGHADHLLTIFKREAQRRRLDTRFISNEQLQSFAVGEMVTWLGRGQKFIAKVIRVNQRTLSCIGHINGAAYKAKVPQQMCEKI